MLTNVAKIVEYVSSLIAAKLRTNKNRNTRFSSFKKFLNLTPINAEINTSNTPINIL